MQSIKDGVQQVVNELYRQSGQVQPSSLVEAARDPESPAHAAFQWDDTKAGAEYRLIQARTWIRKVHIVIEERKEQLVHIPVISVAATSDDPTVEGGEGYYKPISAVMENKSEHAAATREALARLRVAQTAYDRLLITDDKRNRRAKKGFALVESAVTGQRAAL